MENKRLFNRVLIVVWTVLVLAVFGLFFKDRLSQFPQWVRKLRREPAAALPTFGAKNMAGFACDFSRPEDLEIWKTQAARLEIASPPFDPRGRWAKVTYFPSGSPGIVWTEDTMPLMDWRQNHFFAFTVYNPNPWSVDLKIKVKDVAGNVFQRNEKIPPGPARRVEIPISQIAERLDASRVNYLNLFLWNPATETVLYYSSFAFVLPEQPRTGAGYIKFMGLEFPQAVSPGEKIEGSFYFIAHQKMNDDHLLILRLAREGQAFPLGEAHPATPTTKWPEGKLIKVGPLPFTIPAALPPGSYDLEVILACPLGSGAEAHYYFQPYENSELPGFVVTKIRVTAPHPK